MADIDAAVSGEEALALCRKKSYDVILHGYNLGKGKNDQQVLEELNHGKLISPHCIFIIISAESSQAMVMPAHDHRRERYRKLCERLEQL